MAKKNPASAAPASSPVTTQGGLSSRSRGSAVASTPSTSAADILQNLWESYLSKTPQRVKLIDVFMAFLVISGAIQFVYCVLAGNYVCFAILLILYKIKGCRADESVDSTYSPSMPSSLASVLP